MDFTLKEKIAIVTGAAQGIGKAYATHLLAEHSKVMLVDISKTTGESTRDELANKYGEDNVKFITCDVSNDVQFEDVFKETIKTFGKIDLLINNAGIVCEKDPGWKKVIQVNFTAVVKGSYLGLKYMARNEGNEGGTIVNIASITALTPFESVPVYSATKSAVNQFSRSIGTKLHYDRTGVRIITINPGLTDTQILSVAVNVVVDDVTRASLQAALAKCPHQSVTNMARGLIQVLKTAESGSLWLISDEKPARKITLGVDIQD